MLRLNSLQPRISWNRPSETTLLIRIGNRRNEFFNGFHEGVCIAENSANISVIEARRNGVRNVLALILIYEYLVEVKISICLV